MTAQQSGRQDTRHAAHRRVSGVSVRGVVTAVTRTCVALVMFWSVLGHAELSAQVLEGVLLERGSNRPVWLAMVALMTPEGDSVHAVLSDEQGRFRLESPDPGDFLVAASAIGYRTTIPESVFALTKGGSVSIEFRIESVPIEIDGLEVQTRAPLITQPRLVMNGFVERVLHGMGCFITPVDIKSSREFTTSDLLARTGRVTTQYVFGGDRLMMMGSAGYCTPTVYVDGLQVTLELSLDVLVPKEVLVGAEVYRSAIEAPPQYAIGNSGCGVIVLWTQEG